MFQQLLLLRPRLFQDNLSFFSRSPVLSFLDEVQHLASYIFAESFQLPLGEPAVQKLEILLPAGQRNSYLFPFRGKWGRGAPIALDIQLFFLPESNDPASSPHCCYCIKRIKASTFGFNSTRVTLYYCLFDDSHLFSLKRGVPETRIELVCFSARDFKSLVSSNFTIRAFCY